MTVHIEQLSIRIGAFDLHDISLAIEEGEYFVVLGPTGAGKTVLLECIAGLMGPDQGRVVIGGRDVTLVPPEQRNVGYLPQDYALFPHMTVRENMAFGLARRGRAKEAPERTAELAEMLGVTHLLDRQPARLSGGEKQRVALGRALATDPDVMLLDEPLSALDVATRERISDELRRVHNSAGLTSVHISHNFDETIRLADRVALMRAGRIVQVGTPADVLRRPNGLFAAEFVRSENILRGLASRDDGRTRIKVGSIDLLSEVAIEGDVVATVRPDGVHVVGPDVAEDAEAVCVEGLVDHVEDRGNGFAVRTRGALPLTAMVSRPRLRVLCLGPGDSVRLSISSEAVHAFPVDANEESWIGPEECPPKQHGGKPQ